MYWMCHYLSLKLIPFRESVLVFYLMVCGVYGYLNVALSSAANRWIAGWFPDTRGWGRYFSRAGSYYSGGCWHVILLLRVKWTCLLTTFLTISIFYDEQFILKICQFKKTEDVWNYCIMYSTDFQILLKLMLVKVPFWCITKKHSLL